MKPVGTTHGQAATLPGLIQRGSTLLPGVMLCLTLAFAASFVSGAVGGPVMLYALLFGIAFNVLSGERSYAPGIQFSSKTVLRFGVALLGARITLAEVADLGLGTVLLVIAGVAFTIVGGAAIARALKLRPDHAVLSAGAVAICGASAALAISAVLPKHECSERNTCMTVVGVTTLSTIAMVLYPVIAQALSLNDTQAGIFLGATIHDVAQVVGAGYMISDTAGETAAITKLMRIACLVPAVVLIGLTFRKQTGDSADKRPQLLPAFLIGFIMLAAVNSAGWLPASATAIISDFSRWCLVVAVTGLGLKTSIKDFVHAGPRPIAILVLQTAALAVFALGGIALLSL